MGKNLRKKWQQNKTDQQRQYKKAGHSGKPTKIDYNSKEDEQMNVKK